MSCGHLRRCVRRWFLTDLPTASQDKGAGRSQGTDDAKGTRCMPEMLHAARSPVCGAARCTQHAARSTMHAARRMRRCSPPSPALTTQWTCAASASRSRAASPPMAAALAQPALGRSVRRYEAPTAPLGLIPCRLLHSCLPPPLLPLHCPLRSARATPRAAGVAAFPLSVTLAAPRPSRTNRAARRLPSSLSAPLARPGANRSDSTGSVVTCGHLRGILDGWERGNTANLSPS